MGILNNGYREILILLFLYYHRRSTKEASIVLLCDGKLPQATIHSPSILFAFSPKDSDNDAIVNTNVLGRMPYEMCIAFLPIYKLTKYFMIYVLIWILEDNLKQEKVKKNQL